MNSRTSEPVNEGKSTAQPAEGASDTPPGGADSPSQANRGKTPKTGSGEARGSGAGAGGGGGAEEYDSDPQGGGGRFMLKPDSDAPEEGGDAPVHGSR
jgi:hypothetical protein